MMQGQVLIALACVLVPLARGEAGADKVSRTLGNVRIGRAATLYRVDYSWPIEVEQQDVTIRFSPAKRGAPTRVIERRIVDVDMPHKVSIVRSTRLGKSFLVLEEGKYGRAEIFTVGERTLRLKKVLDVLGIVYDRLSHGLVVERSPAKYIWDWGQEPRGVERWHWFARNWRYITRTGRFIHGRWHRIASQEERYG